MKSVKATVKNNLMNKRHLTSYESDIVIYYLKTFLSELSKIIIMSFIFIDKIPFYFYSLFIMLFLRTLTGGIHFYTYFRCLCMSILFIGVSLYISSLIAIPKPFQLIILLISIFICNYIGPIISKYRPAEYQKRFPKCKKKITIFLFTYTIILFIIPYNPYINLGVIVIILHSLQLIVASILKKGELIK